MLWLYIVLAVPVILSFVLFSPVGLQFILDRQGKAAVYICFGFLKFKIRKKSEKQRAKQEASRTKKEEKKRLKSKKKGKKPKSTAKKPPEKKQGGIADKIKDGGIKFIIEVFKDIRDIMAHTGRNIQKHMHLYIRDLDINIANEDPAITGQMYGYVCAVVYPLLNAFKKVIKLKIKRLRINPDFMTDKLHSSCDIKLWILPVFALKLSLGLLKDGIKLYTKHFADNSERKPEKAASKS